MVITLDLFWNTVNLKPDEASEWLGEGVETTSALDQAYADVLATQMADFEELLLLDRALIRCGRLSMTVLHPDSEPAIFEMTLEMNMQGENHRGVFLLRPTSVDVLAERIGNPGYHMTGNVRLELIKRPDVQSPYRRTRSRHIVVSWNKGKSADASLHFPVLYPFDEPVSAAIVYTSWMDLATALSVLIDRWKRMRVA